MEHIIQFGVTIDDHKIQEKIEDQASREILEEIQDLKKKIHKKIFNTDWCNRDTFSDEAKFIIDDFLKDHKDEIIEKAAKELADRLARTKKGKEILGEI